MTMSIMTKTLKKHDVIEFDPLGEDFDPNLHEAIFIVPLTGDQKENTVGNVVNSGWKIGSRVLRSAKVGVIKK